MDNIELLKLHRDGDLTAINKIVEQNSGLVKKIAYQYISSSNSIIDFDDLQQEGYIGLLKAIEYFDISKGFEFSTYAFQWIRQKISKYISENHRSIRIPINTYSEIRKVNRIYSDLYSHLTRAPTTREIASVLNMSAEKVDCLLHMDNEIKSLDKPIGDGEGDITLKGFIKDNGDSPEDVFIEKEFKESVSKWMEVTLDERHLQVIRDYYGFNGECKTYKTIGEKFNISPERVRQLNAKSARLLRSKSWMIKDKMDHIIDFETNYFKSGYNPVLVNVMIRE